MQRLSRSRWRSKSSLSTKGGYAILGRLGRSLLTCLVERLTPVGVLGSTDVDIPHMIDIPYMIANIIQGPLYSRRCATCPKAPFGARWSRIWIHSCRP
jgi:hypothetical protein